MRRDTTVVSFAHPEGIDDPLTTILRDGTRCLLAEAIEAEGDALAGVADRGCAAGHSTATGTGSL